MKRFLLILLLLASPAFAQTSPEELRAREIGAKLRCVVCQNQSIEESDAQLAQDMRRVVREQIATGASDTAVMTYIRDSYGDYVLLKPPVQANTYILWFLPIMLVLGGFSWFIFQSRRKRNDIAIESLSKEDQSILEHLMRDEL